MRTLVTGASGLLGSALTAALERDGHEVSRLVRRAPQRTDEIRWDPAAGTVDAEQLAGFDAVVHLAGDNIASGRWNDAKKRSIRDSRVDGTRVLCEALAASGAPPGVFVGASAIGIYGADRGCEELTEQSALGDDFLAEVCKGWEDADAPLQDKVRVVRPRIGVVLSTKGGALHKMLTPFKLGLGGRVGSGRQYWSWVHLDDVVRGIQHALTCESLSGPCNLTAPQPVTNLAFTNSLGHALRRPTLFPLPAFAVKLLFGEMGEALLLSSNRVLPAALEHSGFAFAHQDLDGALAALLA